jgi:LuxR family maltose regulon positive regulatory protein
VEIPIIATKLNLPYSRARTVSRPRLVTRLEEDLLQNSEFSRQLTLLSAPAGYGKTTLVLEWLNQRDAPAAWVSLDEADNDPRRFITYLIAALDQIHPGLGEATSTRLRAPQPPPDDLLVTTLVNEISTTPIPLTLVLDDYHVIHTTKIHQLLAFLLDHQPANLHLVITTREDPLLPVSKLRARGQVLEIHQDDLRFTADETADFLNRVMGLTLTPEEIFALEHRTEGWIAGLQLAALSMQRRGDLSDFIQAFTGSNRFILDYLIEEVFERQSSEIKNFLLKTSILDKLSSSLCNAVTGETNSQDLLETLEQANLFIVPLDQTRQWYRYHRLFSELLRHRLMLSGQDEAQLHQQASAWYQVNGSINEAIMHALKAKDWESASSLIETSSSDYLKRGEALTVVNWFQAFPEKVLLSNPKLCLEYCWPLMLTTQFEAATPYLAHVETIAKDIPEFLGEVYAAQAYQARGLGDHQRMVERSQAALQLLPRSSINSRAIVAGNLGIAYWHMGQMEAAEQVLQEALEASQDSGNYYLALTSLIFQGRVLAVRGQLHQAELMFQRAIHLGGEISINALAYMDMAALNYEWNRLDLCENHLAQAINLCQEAKNYEFLVGCLMIQLQLRIAQKDMPRAEETMQQVWKIMHDKLIPAPSADRVYVAQAALQLAKGEPLGDLAEKLKHTTDYHPYYRFIGVTKSKILPLQDALGYLAGLNKAARENQWQYGLISVCLLQAVLNENEKQAMEFLSDALLLAEDSGFIRSFVDIGEKLIPLLRKAIEKGTCADYAKALLASMADPIETDHQDQSVLVKPLSDRELEVLRLLADGMTNRQIAEQIVVSVSTVKSHVHHICNKLDADNRTKAVAHARQVGLL